MKSHVLERYLLRELAAAWAAVILVLLAIMMSTRFARLLADAATGEIPKDVLFQVLSLSALQYGVILLPISQLLAVMLTLGRLYKDNEIAAMTGCGVSLMRLCGPFFGFGALLAAGSAFMALEASPWAGRTVEYIVKDARRLVQYMPFEPGRFKEVASGRAVFYTGEMDARDGRLAAIFAWVEEDGGPSLMIAREGHQRVNLETGDREVSLNDGWRYHGTPGVEHYDVMQFGRLDMRVTPPKLLSTGSKRSSTPTSQLFASPDLADRAELQSRLSIPISILLLTVLAVPLAHVRPRAGRYGKLVIGIVVYILYANLLTIGRSWINQGTVAPALGLWWVHAIALIAGVALLARRQGWLR